MTARGNGGKKEVREKLEASISELNDKPGHIEGSLLFENVMRDYLQCIHGFIATDRDGLINLEKKIDQSAGIETRLIYHQALVYQLYLRNIGNIGKQALPEGVAAYLGQDFDRIVELADKGNAARLSFTDYPFLSYIEKLCFKSLPFGNHDVTLSGVPRKLMFKQSLKNMLKMSFSLLSMGGNEPLFELHYNPHRLRLFNPDGWKEVFALAAQTLKTRKEVKGLFGATWFYDPAMKEVSPELSYIRELIEKIGGAFYLAGSSEDDRKNAFFASKARKEAYEEGRYMPTSYMMIIKREALLQYYAS
ncbi:MAG: hypothetical protein OEV42_00560 [Deltaproteobacteria bacterium]|nr:hypothetical protein [Deltaproteobacteria bacterium]